MFYAYFDKEGNLLSCTNGLNGSENNYIEISEDFHIDVATGKKYLHDYKVVKTFKNYILIKKEHKPEIDYDSSSKFISKSKKDNDCINIVQNMRSGNWFVNMDLTNEKLLYNTQLQSRNKMFYIVDSKNPNILQGTFCIDFIQLLQTGTLAIEDTKTKNKNVSLMCFRADEQYIHVQEEQ